MHDVKEKMMGGGMEKEGSDVRKECVRPSLIISIIHVATFPSELEPRILPSLVKPQVNPGRFCYLIPSAPALYNVKQPMPRVAQSLSGKSWHLALKV